MYYQFTRAVKARMIEVLRYCFNADARFADRIVNQIREKYEFTERPQEGIVVQGTSLSPLSLSADNFLATQESHVVFARVDDHEGSFIEWVREDDRAILALDSGFPSPPGVYYLQIQSTGVNPANGCEEFEFFVDPTTRVQGEPLITFDTGNETTATLLNLPLDRSTRLFTQYGYELLSGQGLTLTAAQSLFIGGSATHLPLGVPEGQVPVSQLASNVGSYTFTSGVDDQFIVNVNGKPASVVFTAGTRTTAEVIEELRTAFNAANIGFSESPLEEVGGALQMGGSVSLEFVDDLLSPANAVLGFTAGFVAPSITGLLAQPTVPAGATFRVEVDGTPVEVTLTPTPQTNVTAIANEITAGTSATSLVVGTADVGDFSLDVPTGVVTFLHPFDPGIQVSADYLFPEPSRGPFPIGDGNCANAEAIPGVILAFGYSLLDGDVGAVIVTEEPEAVADLYGGKADVSVEFDVIARDAMTRSELADLVVLYLFHWRRELLAEEGLAIESVNMGGESEEPYDEVAEDWYFLANVSMALKVDWEVAIERPLCIRRVTPSSFEQEARLAAGGGPESADGLQVVATIDGNPQLLRTGARLERVR